MVGMCCVGLFAIGTRCCCVGSGSGVDCGGVGCDGVDKVAAGLVGGAARAAGVAVCLGCPCCCIVAGVALGTVADCVGCVVAGAALGLGLCFRVLLRLLAGLSLAVLLLCLRRPVVAVGWARSRSLWLRLVWFD